MTEQQQQKQRAIDLLESRYRGMENVCEGIDMRRLRGHRHATAYVFRGLAGALVGTRG